MQKIVAYFYLLIMATLLLACGTDTTPEKKKKRQKDATVVTTTVVTAQTVETTQQAFGTIEGLIDPTIAAEVNARVVTVHVNTGDIVKKGQLIATLDAKDFTMQRNEANAEVARIQAQLNNQKKIVARNQKLVDKNFISQNALDNEVAQLDVLKQQLKASRARIGSINHNSNKSKIYAPIAGIVEKRMVGVGDFVRVGDPMIQIVSKQKLRAHLPFPEYIGSQLKPGLKLRLTTPSSDQVVETVIKELKPKITQASRSIEVIADIMETNNWNPGASVTGTVVLEEKEAALIVPENSLVLRPAGEVVYVVKDNIAYQAVVTVGAKQSNGIQIRSGIQAGDTVVVDGAGFLTDNTPIRVAKPEK